MNLSKSKVDTKAHWNAIMKSMLMISKRPGVVARVCKKLEGSNDAELLQDYVGGLEKGIQKLLLKKDKEIRELKQRIEEMKCK